MYVEDRPTSCTTNFDDGSSLTIEFKPDLDINTIGFRFFRRCRTAESRDSLIARLLEPETQATSDEAREGWGKYPALIDVVDELILTVAQGWDCHGENRREILPLTPDNLRLIHPTRRMATGAEICRVLEIRAEDYL